MQLQLQLHWATVQLQLQLQVQLQLQLQLQLPLHLQLQLHYNYNYNYKLHHTTPHYIQRLWVRWPLQLLQKHSSNHLSVHQWNRSATHASVTTHLFYKFPIFETSTTALCGTTGIYLSILSTVDE